MMLSDILRDAILEIERYQRSQPDAYDPYAPDIDECKTAMRTLLVKLDTVPELNRQNPLAKAVVIGGLIAGGAYLLSKFTEQPDPVTVA
jgi:hypothetical protein